VALADVKDDLLSKARRQLARARLRPVNPLAGRSVAETLAPPAMDERERWVFHLVSAAALALKLPVGILVLQDSMGHYLVHFTQGKRLVTYRVDKAWVADAMAGKADQRERIATAVEQYLRQEFLGQPIQKAAPATPPRPAAGPAAAARPGAPAAAAPAGTPAPAATPAGGPPGQELSREERIAAAKAKAEAIRAQRAAGGAPAATGGQQASAQPAAPAAPAPSKPEQEMTREEKIAAAKAKAEAIRAQRAAGGGSPQQPESPPPQPSESPPPPNGPAKP
jgi:hypothetical protein